MKISRNFARLHNFDGHRARDTSIFLHIFSLQHFNFLLLSDPMFPFSIFISLFSNRSSNRNHGGKFESIAGDRCILILLSLRKFRIFAKLSQKIYKKLANQISGPQSNFNQVAYCYPTDAGSSAATVHLRSHPQRYTLNADLSTCDSG